MILRTASSRCECGRKRQGRVNIVASLNTSAVDDLGLLHTPNAESLPRFVIFASYMRAFRRFTADPVRKPASSQPAPMRLLPGGNIRFQLAGRRK